MKRFLVLFGGVSSEHEVSLVSARSVIQNIPRDRYEVLTLGITKQGEWLLYEGDPEALPEDNWLECGKRTPAVLSPDASHHGLLIFENGAARVEHVDVVFPVLHGKNGEDGTMQGLLQLAQLPFVAAAAPPPLSRWIRRLTKRHDRCGGHCAGKVAPLDPRWLSKDAAALRQKAIGRLGFPIFVKPANAGSSVGVGKARNEAELADAIEKAFLHDDKLVLEEGIDGMEVECAVLGNEKPKASTVGEVVPLQDFYDYEAKIYRGRQRAAHPRPSAGGYARGGARRRLPRFHGNGLLRACTRGFLCAQIRWRGASQRAEHHPALRHQHVSQALGTHRPALWRAARPADPARFKKWEPKG